jgi:hypothetical protein
MKRLALAIVALLALTVAGMLGWFHNTNPATLWYAEVAGLRWDEHANDSISVVIRVDDPHVLAQIRQWRAAVRQKAYDESLWRLLGGRQGHCDNALRQPTERLTLIYKNGHRELEQVDIYTTPFADHWRKIVLATRTPLPPSGEIP